MKIEINKLVINRIIVLILLTITIFSCASIRTRNLTSSIVLDTVEESCDTLDFYIKEIRLYDVERLKACDFWGEDSPGITLHVTITNKLNKSIYLIPPNHYYCFFIGIIPVEFKLIGGDTICFSNFFDDHPNLIEPKLSVDFEVSDFGFIDTRLFDLTQRDNTEPLLELVSQLKFYYAPSPEERTMGQDTVVINSTHRLRTDVNTKITSWSRIR